MNSVLICIKSESNGNIALLFVHLFSRHVSQFEIHVLTALAVKLLECLREEVVPPRKEKVVVKVVVKGRRKIRQSGRLQKYSSISVLISP